MHELFQDIPPVYETMLNNIHDQTLNNIYSKFIFIYIPVQINNDDVNKNNEKLSSLMVDYLQNFKFITYHLVQISGQQQFYNNIEKKVFKHDIKYYKELNPVNFQVVFCVERQCIIFDQITISILNQVTNILKGKNITILSVNGKSQENDEICVKKEIDSFCSNFQKDISKNIFLSNSIPAIIGYLIRRYFCPTKYFLDQSFFDFNKSYNSNEIHFITEFNELIDLEIKEPEEYLTIIDKVNDNVKKYNYEEFHIDDFIILRKIYSNDNAEFFLVIHIKSLYIFMMKKIICEEKTKKHEIYFCEKYRHRCFMHFYGFLKDEKGEIIGFIYEYMCNGTLDSYISTNPHNNNKIFSLITIYRIFQGIQYLYSNSLIYRDLKPSNILLDHDFVPYISDFETIRHPIEDNNSTDSFTYDIGSDLYSSPEQNMGEKVSYPTDIYSFGLIIYFFLKREKSFITKEYKLPKLIDSSQNLQYIYENCVKFKQDERIKVEKIRSIFIDIFYSIFFDESFLSYEKTQINRFVYETFLIQNEEIEILIESIIYLLTWPLNKILYDSVAQYNLGYIYEHGYGVKQDYLKAFEYYKISSTNDNSYAQCIIGNFYEHGYGVEQNYLKAYEYYELSSFQNNADALFCLGNLYENGFGVKKDYLKAIEYYESAAKQNNSNALCILGNLYTNGKGIEKNFKKGIEYYELSAKQNNSTAQYNLGVIYKNGDIVEKNYSKALKYFELSAKQNNSDAINQLGIMHLYGFGVKRNYLKAEEYFELSAKQNNSSALLSLGYFYENCFYERHDYLKAKHYFELSAKQNNSFALLKLGDLFLNGNGVKQDFIKAKEYYELSAKHNNSIALSKLGNIYFLGKGVERNYTKAREYFELLAKQNEPLALINLAEIYFYGYDVAKDYLKAKHYYELSANQNNSVALFQIGLFYYKGIGLKQNYLKAIEYFEKSAQKHNSIALKKLGTIYENGYGVRQDYLKAKEYYELASIQYNSSALYKLGIFYLKGKVVKQDYLKAIEYFQLSSYNKYPKAFYILGELYSRGDIFDINIYKSIQYFLQSIKIHFDSIETYVHNDKLCLIKNIYNKFYYHSNNDLGLIYITVFNDLEKAYKYIKEAAFGEYPFGQNNFGLLNEIYYNKINDAEYMYKKSAKNHFALANFNLGNLKEKFNKTKESIEYYIKASEEENCPLIYHNQKHYDDRLEISKTFIICYTNLKLTEYYFINSNYFEAKKYFIKALSKLNINNENILYQFKPKINKGNKESVFIYLQNFILNCPSFNLINQKNLSSDILNNIVLDKNENVKENEIYAIDNTIEKINSILYIEDFYPNKIKFQIDVFNEHCKEKSVNHESHKPILVKDEILFNNANELFDYIISNKEYKQTFAEAIKNIVDIMKKIIYTPPYPILFGRINIDKMKQDVKTNFKRKDINKVFYEGFEYNDHI